MCSGFIWKSDDLGLVLVLAGALYRSFSLPFNRTGRETNDNVHLVSYGLPECTLSLLRLLCSESSCALSFFPILLVLYFFFPQLRFSSCVACFSHFFPSLYSLPFASSPTCMMFIFICSNSLSSSSSSYPSCFLRYLRSSSSSSFSSITYTCLLSVTVVRGLPRGPLACPLRKA